MIYKSIHINHLDRAELEHELNVRGFHDHSGMRMEDMRKKLRTFLKKERSGASAMPSAVDDEHEVGACREKMKKISEMINLLALPLLGTDVSKLKRKLETLIYHLAQRIGRLGDTYEDDKQELSQEMANFIQRFEELTHQTLQDGNSDLDKSDASSHRGEDKLEKIGAASNIPTKAASSSPESLLSEPGGKIIQTKKNKMPDVKKKTHFNRKTSMEDRTMRTKQLSSTESDTSSEKSFGEIYEKRKMKKKSKKNKKKKRSHRYKSESLFSSTTNTSSDEEYSSSTNKRKLRRTPVRLWNLKFSGDDNTSVSAFLADVEDKRVANQMTFRELFNAAGDLLTGSALVVYRSCRGRVKDWQGLEAKLLNAFQDPDYDRRLMREIENRKQGAEETVTVYIAKMRSLFSRLTKPKSEEDMLDIIEENVLPEYQTALCLQKFKNIEELETILRCLEKGRLRAQRYDVRPQKSILEPDLAYKPRMRRDNIKVSTMSTSRATDNKNNQRLDRSRTPTVCWNCRKTGHVFADCFKPKTMFCYGCGKENTIKSKCPTCRSKTNKYQSENCQAEGQTSGCHSAQQKPKTD